MYATSAATSPSLTYGELSELDLPEALALRLSTKSLAVQAWAIRKLAGLPFRPSVARGLTVVVDSRLNVLTIERA